MTLSEKSAYLKGLMDGLQLDTEKPEGKLISGMIDLLQEVTTAISDLKENAIAVSNELDEIEEDLDAIEDYLLDEDDEDDDFDYDDDDPFDDEYEFDDEPAVYHVTCPNCGAELEYDEETILRDDVHCPKCNEPLEFEFDEDDEADEDAEKF